VVHLQRRPRSSDLESQALPRIVRGDSRAGDLERKEVQRQLSIHLAAMSHSERSTKLLEDTTLACYVFRILVDRAGFVELVHAASMILYMGSRFDQDLALHVAGCYVSCVAQAKMRAG
jgi:hypothetical protein